MRKAMLIAAACAIPAAASAEPRLGPQPTGFDPYAAAAIERLDYDAAEARLAGRLADNGGDVSALLNLAAVMNATEREPRAWALYEQVLSAENTRLALPDGSPVWSHDVARSGLAARPTMVAR